MHLQQIAFAALVAFSSGVSADVRSDLGVPQGLPDIMSDDEIHEMGLDQLSAPQQRKLLLWIVNRETGRTDVLPVSSSATASMEEEGPAAAAEIDTAAPAEFESFGKAAPTPDEMNSRIVGTFTGWAGDTRFELENGQVWQQRYEASWKTKLENPEIVIRRHFLGLHRLEVIGTGHSVGVKRIK